MKKKIATFIILLIVFGVLLSVFHEITSDRDEKKVTTQATTEEAIDYSLYYSFGDVEGMVSHLANTTAISGSLSRLSDPLKKSEIVDVAYVKAICETIGVSDTVYSDVLGKADDTELVTKEQFETIYENIVGTGKIKGLLRKDLLVFDLSKEDATSFFDGQDIYSAEFEIKKSFEGSVIDVYMKNGKIFKVNGLGDSSVKLQNIWVEGVENGLCTFMYGDIRKTLPIRDNTVVPDMEVFVATGLDAEPSGESGYETVGYVADLTFDYAGITEISKLTDIVRGHVTEVNDTNIRVEGIGKLLLDDQIKMYNIYEETIPETSLSLLSGYEDVDLFLKNDKVCSVVINRELDSMPIRVIISNDDYSSYEMETVSLTATSPYRITYPDGSSISLDEGERMDFSLDKYAPGDKIVVTPKTHKGRIKLLTVTRECGNPEYDGTIELIAHEGYFYIVNELSLERYLSNVVANVMPSDYEDAALQAMAICARGIAYAKLKDGSYAEYDVHLDDSSLCQVYNNVKETEQSIRAVKDTYGLVPTYRGTLIVPMTFNTSCGTTCTNAEIWGGDTYDYLTSNVENKEKSKIDLSEEASFQAFLEDSGNYDIIDKNSPYYRWDVSFTREDMTEAVFDMLDERKDLVTDSILIQNDAGEFVPGEVKDLGTIEKIEVTKRSESGVVTTLEIYGSKETIQVSGQSHVRTLLSPVNQEIIRQDGTAVLGWTSLPSPYYYVENTESGFVVHGGGFGHGAGMSIYGAGVLAKQGKNYKYILRHYFSYVDFASVYNAEAAETEE